MRAQRSTASTSSGWRSASSVPFALGHPLDGPARRRRRPPIWAASCASPVFQHITWSVNSIRHMFGRRDLRRRATRAGTTGCSRCPPWARRGPTTTMPSRRSAAHGLGPLPIPPVRARDPRTRAGSAWSGTSRFPTSRARRGGEGTAGAALDPPPRLKRGVTEHDRARRTAIALAGSGGSSRFRPSSCAPRTSRRARPPTLRCAYALPVLLPLALRRATPPRTAFVAAFGGVPRSASISSSGITRSTASAPASPPCSANTDVLFVLAGVLAAGGAVSRRSLALVPVPLIWGRADRRSRLGCPARRSRPGARACLRALSYGIFQLLFDRAHPDHPRRRLAALRRSRPARRCSALAATLVSGEDLVPSPTGPGLDAPSGARAASGRLAADRARRRAARARSPSPSC